MNLLSSYVYIPVLDYEIATKWYKDVFGFELVFTDPLYRELRSLSGIRIMLIERRGGVNSHMMYDNNTSRQPAYGFTVNNIEEIYAILISKNVKVKKITNYQGKVFSFFDLDENKIEIWEEIKES